MQVLKGQPDQTLITTTRIMKTNIDFAQQKQQQSELVNTLDSNH